MELESRCRLIPLLGLPEGMAADASAVDLLFDEVSAIPSQDVCTQHMNASEELASSTDKDVCST